IMPTLAERYGVKDTPTLAERYGGESTATPTLAERYGAKPTLADRYMPDAVETEPIATPAEQPAPEKPSLLSRFGSGLKNVGKMFTQSGQEELLDNPETAGVAGAILGPLAVISGGLAGDSPIAETEYENRSKAAMQGIEYTPQGPVDPLMAEKVGGAVGRIMAT